MSTAEPGDGEIDEYRLIRKLSSNPVAYLAHDRALDRPVVVVFRPNDSDRAEELFGCLVALAKVSHPALTSVHKLKDEGERPYAVIEFAAGEPLDRLPLPLPSAKVESFGRRLAGGLASLHAEGIVHGDVRSERVVVSPEGVPRLLGAKGLRSAPGSAAFERDVRALLALLHGVADAGLRQRLATLVGRRTETAEGLLHALDGISRPAGRDDVVVDNPYPGLDPFTVRGADLFFGRQASVAEALARLEGSPWLVVTAPAGAGKTSFALAGIAAAICRGDLGERSTWDVLTVAPGARPLTALAAALAPLLEIEAHALRERLVADASLAARMARARTTAGLVLVIDPFDDVLSATHEFERNAFLGVLASFASLSPGVRTLLTLRPDSLELLGELGAVSRGLLAAMFVLPPMRDAEVRAAIVGPARARGFEMELEATVDAFVTEMRGSPEALPLLSFTLSALWSQRDIERRVIPKSALIGMRGAARALANHGELVLASLRPEARKEARRILVALATLDDDKVQGGALDADSVAAREALDALVSSRLVVEGRTYKLAHARIVRAWPRLRSWLDEASSARAAAKRLELAARDWKRLGCSPDELWNERQMRDVASIGVEAMDETSRAFLDASRAANRRWAARRWVWRLGLPLALALVAAAVVGIRSWKEQRRASAVIGARLAEGSVAEAEADRLDALAGATQADAFMHYDASDVEGGETRWKDALALADRAADRFAAAAAAYDLALAIDPQDSRARLHRADVTLHWLLAAERAHQPSLIRDLSATLEELDDDGSRRARLSASGHLSVATSPPGAQVRVHSVRVAENGRRLEDDGSIMQLDSEIELWPGSYVLSASAPGRYPTRYPFLMHRSESARVLIVLPDVREVPHGYMYVPEGVSLVGARDVDPVRKSHEMEPEHATHVNAFLVAEHETTFAEYLEFLSSLPGSEREARRPRGFVDLSVASDDMTTLRLGARSARRGELVCRPDRTVQRCQDWLKMPVEEISWDDAVAYESWLSRDRIPGARLCTEREWERAARGADGRVFPWGDEVHVGDANLQGAYGVKSDALGEDEIGSFPIDRSVFGVFDLAGNVSEWVRGDAVGPKRDRQRVVRGGDWDNVESYAVGASRLIVPGTERRLAGIRSCAAAPTTY
jgi:formylglycine-generating enzyme required for sulfatase activity